MVEITKCPPGFAYGYVPMDSSREMADMQIDLASQLIAAQQPRAQAERYETAKQLSRDYSRSKKRPVRWP